MTHVFDEAIALQRGDDGVIHASTHPAYSNMVGPFGGITAATVLNVIATHPDVLGEPLALTLNYAAPIADGPWEIDVVPVRTNRSNQHWVVTLRQNDGTVGTGTAVFGLHRGTWGDTEATPPQAPPVAEVDSFDFPDFIAWSQNYDMKFIVGGIDAGKQDDSTTTLWIRDTPDRPLDYPALMSLTDTFFPRVFLRHGTMMPAGTISITTYFHATPDQLAAHGTAYVLGTAAANSFANGHYDQSGQIWSMPDDGEPVLLASTTQLVYFKDPQA